MPLRGRLTRSRFRRVVGFLDTRPVRRDWSPRLPLPNASGMQEVDVLRGKWKSKSNLERNAKKENEGRREKKSKGGRIGDSLEMWIVLEGFGLLATASPMDKLNRPDGRLRCGRRCSWL